MAYDFRANQIRLNRIISSGSVPILIYPSSSAADFSGNLVPSFSTASIGTDVFFFISGSSTAKTVFGGDILTSGSFHSLKGITGSVRYTDTASTPFIIGGSDVTVNYNSLGQWEISGSEANFFTSPSNGIVQTTGSLFVAGLSSSGGAQITGSLVVTQTLSASIVSASYVRANGFDITPILGQLTIGGDNTNRASGSISGLFESGSLMTPGSIGKFDVEVLAMDYNFETGASWKFTITALWPYSGNFTIIASTELAAEYGPSAGSYNPAVEWDVNFNNLGQIELTGSTPAFPMGGTSFYVQVTKKMIGGYATIIA